jgi:hypothetical protein
MLSKIRRLIASQAIQVTGAVAAGIVLSIPLVAIGMVVTGEIRTLWYHGFCADGDPSGVLISAAIVPLILTALLLLAIVRGSIPLFLRIVISVSLLIALPATLFVNFVLVVFTDC